MLLLFLKMSCMNATRILYLMFLYDLTCTRCLFCKLLMANDSFLFFHAQPRRSRTTSSVPVPISMDLVFRSDAVFLLLRKAYKDPSLGNVCRTVRNACCFLMYVLVFLHFSGWSNNISIICFSCFFLLVSLSETHNVYRHQEFFWIL